MTAAEYFKNTKGFERLISLCRKKYVSVSRVGGTVTVKAPSQYEREAIGGLFGNSFEGDIKIKLAELDSALKESRFKIGLETLLEEYYGEAIITRSQNAEESRAKKDAFFKRVRNELGTGKAALWVQSLSETDAYIIKRLNSDSEKLYSDIAVVCKALELLGKPYLLPVFSAAASGDPHCLDYGTACGTLFDRALEFINSVPRVKTSMQRTRLLESVNIYSDMVSSFVYCKNIELYDRRGIHKGVHGFNERNEACTLNIGNIASAERAEAIGNIVYAVENPAVFTALADAAEGVSLICTAGQPKGAAVMLFEMLGDTEIMYSGDFDGGGISIAVRLMKEFPNIKLWHYDTEDYMAAQSEVELSKQGAELLSRLEDERISDVIRAVISCGKVGYQENILPRLLADLR